jgi:hypothetical protein
MKQLLWFAFLPIGVVLFISVFIPGIGIFYSSLIGQVIVVVSWIVSAAAYVGTNLFVQRRIRTREYAYTIADTRSESAFRPAQPQDEEVMGGRDDD